MKQQEKEKITNNFTRRVLIWLLCVCANRILIPLLVFVTTLEQDLQESD